MAPESLEGKCTYEAVCGSTCRSDGAVWERARGDAPAVARCGSEIRSPLRMAAGASRLDALCGSGELLLRARSGRMHQHERRADDGRRQYGHHVLRAYTSSAWFHEWATRAQTMLFPKGKTKFIRPDGSIGRAPGHGIVLLGMGETANAALRGSQLGLFLLLRPPVVEPQPALISTVGIPGTKK